MEAPRELEDSAHIRYGFFILVPAINNNISSKRENLLFRFSRIFLDGSFFSLSLYLVYVYYCLPLVYNYIYLYYRITSAVIRLKRKQLIFSPTDVMYASRLLGKRA